MKTFLCAATALVVASAGCAGGGEDGKRDAAPKRDKPLVVADQAVPGTAGAPCYGNGTCNPGLTCDGDVCVPEVEADAAPPADLPTPDLTVTDGPVHPEARILDARLSDLPPKPDGVGKPCTTNPECDDSLPCTTDLCGVNGCTNIPTAGCVIAGKCFAAGALNTANDCEVCDPLRSTTSWSNADEHGCDDGDDCTHGDRCVARKCAGTPYSCDDNLDCTTDSCTGTAPPAGCTNELVAGQCVIMDTCVTTGDTDPLAPCLICDPTKDANDWSIKAGFCFIDNTCQPDSAANPLNTCEVCDAATKPTTWSATTPTPSPHQVVITEFMADPLAVADTYGEWLEIYNATSAGIDLDGWTLKDEGSDTHVIKGPLMLGAGQHMVLARSTNTAINGGVAAAYQYASFLLSNTDDEIILIDSACRAVDHVRFDATWNIVAGSAHALREPTLDNAFAVNWCSDQAAWSGSAGDKGTPGAPNVCGLPPVDAGPDLPPPDSGPPPPDTGLWDMQAVDGGSAGDSGAIVPCVTTGVVLDEVAVGNTDFVALRNRGTAAVSIVGYRVEMYGISPYAPDVYTIKATDVAGPLAAGARVYLFEYSAGTQTGDINTGTNIPFYNGPPSAARPNAVALYDASGNMVDYWAVGDTIGKPANVTFTAIAWPAAFSATTQSFRRGATLGACPTFKYTDWGYGPLTR